MANVVLTCGLTCSGKSTYARTLEERGYAWLSVDTDSWQLGYERHPLPPDVQRDIRTKQKAMLRELLAEGRDVVLEYAFASRSHRDEYRRLAREAGAAEVGVVFFDVPLEELLRRLEARNAGPRTAHTVIVDPAQLVEWYERFEWPQPDETDVTTIR
jgi:predicted kinase